ncbi:protein disulfide-isomerase A4-like [Lytechinus pictus]|uniref:protein disulfide-isomerase A4-like n=1 Tax=Lytechinus pictus TaxID=7653 RepID=UPI00240E90C2|nr:protein disulfide-isomerase A4-like [Lytechinus pictus]
MSSSNACLVLFLYLLSMLLNVAQLENIGEEEVKATKPKYFTKDEYNSLIETDDRFLVNFVSPGCIKCNEFAPEYEEVARYFATEKAEMNIKVFIEGDLQVIRKQALRRLPSLYYVRDKTPILYTGKMDAYSVIHFVEFTGRKIHLTLIDDDFEHRTQAATGSTTGPWLILFCNVENPDCSILLPMWENIAYKLHGMIVVAVLDVATSPQTAKRFKLTNTPSMQLFKNGKRYVYNLQMRDEETIEAFAKNGFKQVTAIDVVPPPSPFDTLTENIADQVKEVLSDEHSSKLVYIGLAVVIVLVIIFVLIRCRPSEAAPERTKKGV